MSDTGTIVSWKPGRGFGFIRPDQNGKDVFVHISAFRRDTNPTVGDRVHYKVTRDERGRIRAEQVRSKGKRISINYRSWLRPAVATSFLLILACLVYLNIYPLEMLFLYLLASLACFVVYGWDKWSARRGAFRVSEINLHLLAIFAGWPGALFAQQVFRHKSRKKSFQIKFWITVLLNCAILTWLLTSSGKPFAVYLFDFLREVLNYLGLNHLF
ncbi:MAG: DUF1294 domain-containing protein [Xanthomonadales bacterium]|nr:DUF1294 domain-containing protein [Xanthomonadales bacterium]